MGRRARLPYVVLKRHRNEPAHSKSKTALMAKPPSGGFLFVMLNLVVVLNLVNRSLACTNYFPCLPARRVSEFDGRTRDAANATRMTRRGHHHGQSGAKSGRAEVV